MTESPLLDYYVGLMRGYLLAQNAPTQILNALDVLLVDYKSKAGRVIGVEPKKEPQAIPMPSQSKMPPVEFPVAPEVTSSEKKMVFWTKADDETLEEMYCGAGDSPKVIAARLNRTPASISARIQIKGFKRGEK